MIVNNLNSDEIHLIDVIVNCWSELMHSDSSVSDIHTFLRRSHESGDR